MGRLEHPGGEALAARRAEPRVCADWRVQRVRRDAVVAPTRCDQATARLLPGELCFHPGHHDLASKAIPARSPWTSSNCSRIWAARNCPAACSPSTTRCCGIAVANTRLSAWPMRSLSVLGLTPMSRAKAAGVTGCRGVGCRWTLAQARAGSLATATWIRSDSTAPLGPC